MTCGACGTPNPPAARYCLQCGQPFGAPCPRCGAPTYLTARYCIDCGTPLPVDATATVAAFSSSPFTVPAAPDVAGLALPTSAAVLPEERRLVTVLFADVVG